MPIKKFLRFKKSAKEPSWPSKSCRILKFILDKWGSVAKWHLRRWKLSFVNRSHQIWNLLNEGCHSVVHYWLDKQLALRSPRCCQLIQYLDNPIRKRSNFRSCFECVLIQLVFLHEIKIRIIVDFSLKWATSKHWSCGSIFLLFIHVEPSIDFGLFAFTFVNSSDKIKFKEASVLNLHTWQEINLNILHFLSVWNG